MIEVDTSKLKDELQRLSLAIEEYEEIELNLFNQLNASSIDWQDGRTSKYESQIALDKKESDLYLRSLISKREVLQYIYDSYRALGKRIRVNLNSKKTVLRSIEECYNEVSKSLEEISRIELVDRTVASSISTIRSKIVAMRKDLSNLADTIKKLYFRIETIEDAVEERIVSLEEIKINDFEFVL